jgi:hypothetical protein
MELFGHHEIVGEYESPALLSHHSIRASMEEEVKAVALGQVDKETCVKHNLDWFEDRYSELESSLTWDRVNAFGKDLRPSRDYLRYLQKLGAFEPKVAVINKGKEEKAGLRQPNLSPKKARKGKTLNRLQAHKVASR